MTHGAPRLVLVSIALLGVAVIVAPGLGALVSTAQRQSKRTPTVYPLLVVHNSFRVYGPSQHAGSACPRLLALPRHSDGTVRTAVKLAMPVFEARLKLNGTDAHVAVKAAESSGYEAIAGGCGERTWNRSLVASVRLPHIPGASLSQHTFAVGRMAAGWVLWAWIH
jgi:hypothetical protein